MSKTEENNGYGIHEVLDRTNLLLTILEDFIINHKELEDLPEIKKLYEESSDKLSEAYQLVGRISFEK
jgi:hypothetical protein